MGNDFYEIQLDKEDFILLLLDANARLLGRDILCGITRLEKLLFLLERETNFQGVGQFVFEPHNFGPFSKEVYEAVEFLESCDLIEICERGYVSFYASNDEAKLTSEIADDDEPMQVTEKLYSLTERGKTVATKLRQAVAAKRPEDIKALESVVLRYAAWPLNQLIRYVYRRYPEMTVKSIHPEARDVRY